MFIGIQKYPASNEVNSQCLASNKKKNWQSCKEIVKYDAQEEKIQLIKTDPEIIQMVKLADKVLKVIILVVFHMFKKWIKTEQLSHEKYKKTHIEFLEMKTTLSEVKKTCIVTHL